MKLFKIDREVMSGQCKGALLRLQIRYTAIFFFPDLIPGWAGSHIGIFSPRKTANGYKCTGFYFRPWLSPDIAVGRLPKSYVKMLRFFSFDFSKDKQ